MAQLLLIWFTYPSFDSAPFALLSPSLLEHLLYVMSSAGIFSFLQVFSFRLPNDYLNCKENLHLQVRKQAKEILEMRE